MFCTLVDLFEILKFMPQPLAGGVRLLLTVVVFCVLTTRDTGSVNDFSCHPETKDGSTEECFSKYSAEMSSFMHPQFFVIITAVVLFFFWSVMILYSYRQGQKIKRTAQVTAITKMKDDFWGKVLRHVRCEAVFISVSLGLFLCTQKIHFAETYNCITRNAPVEIVLTCRDKHQQDKKDLNIYFFGGMISILFCCMWVICRAKKSEDYFKEMVGITVKESEEGYDGNQLSRAMAMLDVEFESCSSAVTSNQSSDERQVKRRKVEVKRDDDGKHRRNTQSHSEKRVARVSDDIFQVIVNDFTIREDFINSFGRVVYPLHHPVTIVHVISEWIEDICSVMNSGELEERDKMLDVLEQLPLSEVFDQRVTRKAVIHRKRSTDIAKDRDESFQVSVSRRIVAIVDKWMEEIFSVMNSGEPGERDKILDELERLLLTEVFDQRISERERFERTSYLGGWKKTHGGLVPSRLEARENGSSSVMHRKHNTDIAQDRDESFQVSVSRRIVAIVVKWMEEIFRGLYSGKREERDKILHELERLLLTEVFDQRISERAVMRRKRITDIAQDRDESFEVSVRRRIVAIVARWLREIVMLINSGGVEERDKILDIVEQLPLSEVLDQRITERGYRL